MAAPAQLVTSYLSSFAGGDPDVIAGFVSEGFRNEHLSALGTGSVGRAEYRRRLPDFLASFADRSYTVDDLVEQRRDAVSAEMFDVVVRYRFAATFDGHRIEIPGVMWFGVRHQLIASRVDAWDALTFLQQTGRR